MDIMKVVAKECLPMGYNQFACIVSYRTGLFLRKITDDYLRVLLAVGFLKRNENMVLTLGDGARGFGFGIWSIYLTEGVGYVRTDKPIKTAKARIKKHVAIILKPERLGSVRALPLEFEELSFKLRLAIRRHTRSTVLESNQPLQRRFQPCLGCSK